MRYQLICFKDEFRQPHHLAFRESTPLGHGSFGKVYLAYPFTFKKEESKAYPRILEYKTADSRELTLDKKQPFVIKVIPMDRQSAAETVQEYKHAKHYINCFHPESFNGKHYFCQEYLPGEEIAQRRAEQSTAFQELNFIKRSEMALSLALSFHRFSVNNRETGSPIYHHDLKGENVKVDIEEGWPIDLHIFDFGLSESTDVDEPEICGTPGYASPEAARADYHPNSDVYSIGVILLSIFGALAPLKNSNEFFHDKVLDIDEEIEGRCKIQCNFKGLLKGRAAIPPVLNQTQPDRPIDTLVRSFIQRMLRKRPEERPSPDQCLHFFTALNLLCQQFLFNQKVDDDSGYKGKLRHSVFETNPKYDLSVCINRMQVQLDTMLPEEDEEESADEEDINLTAPLMNPWFACTSGP